jgi:Xaa-Pro aminopeptidase
MSLKLSIFITVFCAYFSMAQNDAPSDYLSAQFHKERREALRSKMPNNSLAVFFGNPVRNRANDVDYVYHQDPDFYFRTIKPIKKGRHITKCSMSRKKILRRSNGPEYV